MICFSSAVNLLFKNELVFCFCLYLWPTTPKNHIKPFDPWVNHMATIILIISNRIIIIIMIFNNPQDILPQWWSGEGYPGAKQSSTNYRVIRKKVDIFKYSKRKVMIKVTMLIMVMVMTILMLMLFTLTLIATRWGDGGWVPPKICGTPSKVNFLEFGNISKNPFTRNCSLFH